MKALPLKISQKRDMAGVVTRIVVVPRETGEVALYLVLDTGIKSFFDVGFIVSELLEPNRGSV